MSIKYISTGLLSWNDNSSCGTKAIKYLAVATGNDISAPSENQYMHSWYAKLLSTGFAGKQLVMYVHDPSLLLVLAPGKSINTTLLSFYQHLPLLLEIKSIK